VPPESISLTAHSEAFRKGVHVKRSVSASFLCVISPAVVLTLGLLSASPAYAVTDGITSTASGNVGLYTGGSERMHIDSSGHVGIGTASPGSTLEVNGTISATTYVNAIPSGLIAAFASASCPTGWTEYTPARGRFLRGIDNGAGNDPAGTRTPGNQQADAMQGHKHSVTTDGSGASVMVGNGLGSFGAATSNWSVGTVVVGNPTSDGTNGTPRTAAETRPVNVAVTFCQKS
jgi:hypothetical protein